MMRRPLWLFGTAALIAAILAGWWWRSGTDDADASYAEWSVVAPDLLDQPSPDLSEQEMAAFLAGQQLFRNALPFHGPEFNDIACADCHFTPTTGGSGDLVHVAPMGPNASNDDVELHRRHAVAGRTLPQPPPNVSHRVAPPLYGLGLIERIPDETIRAACGPGGHVNFAKMQGSQPVNRIARFGVKPFLGTVPDFVGAALFSESSVTNPVEGTPDDDEHKDPEVDRAYVELLAAYVRGLPRPGPSGTEPAGEAAFHSFGCASCHVPDMPPAMGVYSDFCVHPMGPELADGIVDHEAKGDEFRTTPLWGLRFRTHYLHDGRAMTVHDAIVAHGGNAEAAASAYRHAADDLRAALLRFLATR